MSNKITIFADNLTDMEKEASMTVIRDEFLKIRQSLSVIIDRIGYLTNAVGDGSADDDIGNRGLSNRSVHALRNNGIERVSDLCCVTIRQISGFRNIGVKCVNEIRTFAKANGIDINEQ